MAKKPSKSKKNLKLKVDKGSVKKLTAADLEHVAGGGPSSMGTTSHCESVPTDIGRAHKLKA